MNFDQFVRGTFDIVYPSHQTWRRHVPLSTPWSTPMTTTFGIHGFRRHRGEMLKIGKPIELTFELSWPNISQRCVILALKVISIWHLSILACDSPLGMEDRRIPDSQITASSEYDSNHGPTNARLNRPADGSTIGAWSARTNDLLPWIQVDFGAPKMVSGIMMQGRKRRGSSMGDPV